MSGLVALVTGNATLIVGVEDDPDGSLRVYLGARYTGIHVHVDDEAGKAEVRRAWGSTMGHVVVEKPHDDALCSCPEAGGDQ